MLKPNIGSKHIKIMTKKLMITALNLEILKSSMVPAIELSKTAIIVDPAAIHMNRKNNVPQSRPPAIFTKTFGNVTKISDGPASG